MAGRRLFQLCVLGTMCAACAPTPKILEVRDYKGTFVCEGGQSLHVLFTPYNALLQSQDMSVAMTQQPAADGFLYAGGGQSLRAHGVEATWTDGKGAVHHCREDVAANRNG